MRFPVRFFFYQHLFIGCCAVAMCVQTMLLRGIDPGIHFSFLIFVFSATIFSYTGHFMLAARKSSTTDQLKWYSTHRSLNFASLIISGLILLALTVLLSHLWKWFITAFLLNIMYTGPLLLKKPLFLPKLLTYLKSYVVGFVWAFVSAGITIAAVNMEFRLADAWLFFNQFMLVSLNVLIFDYRDKLPDYEFGIHTPANTLNEKQFTLFYTANLFIFAAIVIAVSVSYHLPGHLLQLLLVPFLVYFFHWSKRTQSELFYLFAVDGAMILTLLLSLFLRF